MQQHDVFLSFGYDEVVFPIGAHASKVVGGIVGLDALYLWLSHAQRVVHIGVHVAHEVDVMDVALPIGGGEAEEPYSKWIINKDLLYITWNYTQCYVAAWMGGENGHMYMYG